MASQAVNTYSDSDSSDTDQTDSGYSTPNDSDIEMDYEDMANDNVKACQKALCVAGRINEMKEADMSAAGRKRNTSEEVNVGGSTDESERGKTNQPAMKRGRAKLDIQEEFLEGLHPVDKLEVEDVLQPQKKLKQEPDLVMFAKDFVHVMSICQRTAALREAPLDLLVAINNIANAYALGKASSLSRVMNFVLEGDPLFLKPLCFAGVLHSIDQPLVNFERVRRSYASNWNRVYIVLASVIKDFSTSGMWAQVFHNILLSQKYTIPKVLKDSSYEKRSQSVQQKYAKMKEICDFDTMLMIKLANKENCFYRKYRGGRRDDGSLSHKITTTELSLVKNMGDVSDSNDIAQRWSEKIHLDSSNWRMAHISHDDSTKVPPKEMRPEDYQLCLKQQLGMMQKPIWPEKGIFSGCKDPNNAWMYLNRNSIKRLRLNDYFSDHRGRTLLKSASWLHADQLVMRIKDMNRAVKKISKCLPHFQHLKSLYTTYKKGVEMRLLEPQSMNRLHLTRKCSQLSVERKQAMLGAKLAPIFEEIVDATEPLQKIQFQQCIDSANSLSPSKCFTKYQRNL